MKFYKLACKTDTGVDAIAFVEDCGDYAIVDVALDMKVGGFTPILCLLKVERHEGWAGTALRLMDVSSGRRWQMIQDPSGNFADDGWTMGLKELMV